MILTCASYWLSLPHYFHNLGNVTSVFTYTACVIRPLQRSHRSKRLYPCLLLFHGILPLGPALLLFISGCRPQSLANSCWSRLPDIFILLHSHRSCDWRGNQVREALQALPSIWGRSLHLGDLPHAMVPQHRHAAGCDCGDADPGWHWRRLHQRPNPAWNPGECEPAERSMRHCYLSDAAVSWRRCRIGNFGRSMVINAEVKAGVISPSQ